MLNKVQFIGNLTRDPEFNGKEGSSSRAVLFLAVNTRYPSKDGWQTRADFPIIVAFGPRARYASGLAKGEQVLVEAEYRTQRFEKDGETQFSHQLIAGTVQRLRARPSSSGDNAGEDA